MSFNSVEEQKAQPDVRLLPNNAEQINREDVDERNNMHGMGQEDR